MKKIILLFLLFIVFKASAQNYWSTSPAGWAAASSVSFRYKTNTPDSTNSLLIFNALTGKYYRLYTAVENNSLLSLKANNNNVLHLNGYVNQIAHGSITLIDSVYANSGMYFFPSTATNFAHGMYVNYGKIQGFKFVSGFAIPDTLFENPDGGIVVAGTGRSRVIDASQIGSGLNYSGGILTATGSGGTVINFSKTDGYGIISSVTNPTTTPNYSARVDTAVIETKAAAARDSALFIKRTIGAIRLSTIALMQTYTGTVRTIVVSDINRGGVFNYVSTGLTSDGGTVFPAVGVGSGYWQRQIYDNNIYSAWYGGTDLDRIQAAVNKAASIKYNAHVSPINSRDGSSTWLLDSAIMLPAYTTLYIDNCLLKLSNISRDNIFRSANVGFGITSPVRIKNIRIIGTGNASIQGADNPRSTGDSGKALTTTPTTQAFSAFSYGTDAGVSGQTQTGDWRNIGILVAMCDTVQISNLTIRKTHAWAVSLERCSANTVKNIIFDNDSPSSYGGFGTTYVRNRDGVDFITGGSGVVDGITGRTGDDTFAASMINSTTMTAGNYGQMPVTGLIFNAATDTMKHINVSNINTFSGASQVRVLNTGPNLIAYDFNISHISDASVVGDYNPAGKHVTFIGDNNPTYGGATPIPNTSRFHISDITSSNDTYAISIPGSLSESTITGIVNNAPGGLWLNLPSGSLGFRNVIASNIYDSNGKIFSTSLTGTATEVSLKLVSNIPTITDSQSLTGLRAAADYSTNFNSLNYMTRVASDARYLQSFTETDPIYTANGVSLAGTQTISGAKTFSNVATFTNTITSNLGASTNREFLQVGGVLRWVKSLINAESGSNSGSDYNLIGRADDGSFLGNWFTIKRSNGQITIPNLSGTGVVHSTSGVLSNTLIQSADLASSLAIPGSPTTTTQAVGTNNTTITTMAALFAERAATASLSNKTFLPANIFYTPTATTPTADSVLVKEGGKLFAVSNLSLGYVPYNNANNDVNLGAHNINILGDANFFKVTSSTNSANNTYVGYNGLFINTNNGSNAITIGNGGSDSFALIAPGSFGAQNGANSVSTYINKSYLQFLNNGFTGQMLPPTTLTGARTWTWPDKSGTAALISDIPVYGTITLVAGVGTATVTGVSTSSKATTGFVSVGGTVSTTWQYKVTCTANTITITAITNTNATDVTDTSTLNFAVKL